MTPTQIKRVIAELEGNDIEELILAKANLAMLDNGFQAMGIDSPEWITDGLEALSREITNRNRGELERQLKVAKSRRESLASIDEKRGKLEEQIKLLEGKLK